MSPSVAFCLGGPLAAGRATTGAIASRQFYPHRTALTCTTAGDVQTAKVSSIARKASAWLDAQLTAGIDRRLPLDGAMSDWQTRAKALLVDEAPPTRSDEDWRFTDLRALYEAPMTIVSDTDDQDALAQLVDDVIGPFDEEETSGRAIVVDGTVKLVNLAPSTVGLALSSWVDADKDTQQASLEALASAKETGLDSGDLFHLLNAAVMSDVLVLSLAKGTSVKPIQILYVASGGQESASDVSCCHPRLVVLAGDNSRASIVEQHVSLDQGRASFVNSCSTVRVSAGAHVEHAVLSMLSDDSFHIGGYHTLVQKDGTFSGSQISSSGRATRATVGIDMVEPGASCKLFGLGIANRRRTVDLHSRIVHGKPNCTSEQLHKQIASDRGHAVFRGRILVEKGAVQTDSSQLCRSLLLSSTAEIDAMPNLEINCDDVKCTHGATVADLDVDELFYIASRGIDLDRARYLMISGFVEDMLQRVPLASGKDTVRESVRALSAAVEAKETGLSNFASV